MEKQVKSQLGFSQQKCSVCEVLRGISGPKADEVRGVRKFYNEELVTFMSSTHIVKAVHKRMTNGEHLQLA